MSFKKFDSLELILPLISRAVGPDLPDLKVLLV